MGGLRSIGGVLLALAGLICAAIVVLAIAGAVINYSPVPNADMWNGAIGFVLDVDDGQYAAWWAQHNEHRILLSRLFFWLDIKLFGGIGVFLVVTNYVLVVCSVITFFSFVNKLYGGQRKSLQDGRVLLLMLATAFLFLWSQEGNLEWAFQCHFFLAQLLPLCALFWLAKSVESGSRRDFVIASLLGGASVWALANGVLILPLMILYSIILGCGIRRTGFISALGAIMVVAYFYDYHAPEHHGHLLDTLKNHPWDLLHYTMLYLGGAAFYIFGQGEAGKLLALLSGMILTGATATIAWVQFKKANKNPFIVALIFFIVYIGGTAFGAGGSRLIFGMDQALSSRYTTPSNMAWVALFIVVWHERYLAFLGKVAPVVVVVFMSCMLVFQLDALKSAREVINTREIAALASALDIDDVEYIRNVFPDPSYVLDITKRAIDSNYSIFNTYPYKGLKKEIGNRYDAGQQPACLGSLERVLPLPGVESYVRVNGWLFDPHTKTTPKLIRFTGSDGAVVGFAFTGGVREDVRDVISHKAGTSGFTGYILSSQSGAPITATSNDLGCAIKFTVQSM
ncbi:hypothetical protein [Pseudomonas atagonensis]|uniref:hypothetical protein n=1 Tax=Pseudomonas atagonensis TaxID=2609964 RepID=UPI00140920AD|nr:hypothetical protein [Pseudomonas atagonensis]